MEKQTPCCLWAVYTTENNKTLLFLKLGHSKEVLPPFIVSGSELRVFTLIMKKTWNSDVQRSYSIMIEL